MLSVLFAVVVAGSNPCEAAKRPVTYVADTNLSVGPAENFRQLFVDPRRLNKLLDPLNDPSDVRPQARVSEDTIELSDRVFFAPNSHTLKPSSYTILDSVAQVMQRRPDIASVQIQGFSSAHQDADQDLALSVRRTKTVVDHLVTRGIAIERLSSMGFGGTRTAAKGTTEQDRDENQPVQFIIRRWKDVPGMKEVEEMGEAPPPPGKDAPRTGSLLIVNDAMTFAEVSVNGTRIGVVGPLTDVALHGLDSGLYDVGLTHPTGFTHYRAQRTQRVQSPIVPGGKRAIRVLPNNGLPAPESAVREAAE